MSELQEVSILPSILILIMIFFGIIMFFYQTIVILKGVNNNNKIKKRSIIFYTIGLLMITLSSYLLLKDQHVWRGSDNGVFTIEKSSS